MGLFDAIGISGTGLTAERIRMDVTAENLANADTTKGANGQPYQRQEVEVGEIGSDASFSGALSSALSQTQGSSPAGGVQVTGIVSDDTPDQEVYDPSNPEADSKGYVKMPNVSTVTEMTDLISEQETYQSDVTAMNTSKSIFTSMIGILK
jgi:flagellar basal-body rod protein FlgC